MQSVIEIHESVGRPNPLAKLFLRHYLASVFEENCENLERLFLEANS